MTGCFAYDLNLATICFKGSNWQYPSTDSSNNMELGWEEAIKPKPMVTQLTHWGRVTHICVSKLNTIDSDNGLSPSGRQAVIWTNAGILLIRTLGTNCVEIIIKIHTFSFKKMHLKMSSGTWRPSCLGLNVLTPMYVPPEAPFTNML